MSNKHIIYVALAVLVGVLAGTIFTFAINTQAEGHRLPPSVASSTTIQYYYSPIWGFTNNCAFDVFIPTRTLVEFDSFASNLPSCVQGYRCQNFTSDFGNNDGQFCCPGNYGNMFGSWTGTPTATSVTMYCCYTSCVMYSYDFGSTDGVYCCPTGAVYDWEDGATPGSVFVTCCT
jgi:hypothetical protein